MAEGDIGAVIDTLVFDAAFCNYPSMIHISGDVYAIAYQAPDGDGWAVTIPIDSSGNITGAAIIDSYEFSTGCTSPHIIHVYGDIYVVVAEDDASNLRVITLNIDSDGNIADPKIDAHTYVMAQCKAPRIIHVGGTTYAIVYSGAINDGFITTITISGGGFITDTAIETLEFMITDCIDPDILNVGGEIYAIAYRGDDNDGFVSTIEITALGDIADAVIETLEFETDTCYNPALVNIAGQTYAVAFQGVGNVGTIKTFTISSAGDIGASVIDTFVFNAATTHVVDISVVSGGFIGIVYQGALSHGHLCTFRIAADGTINDGTLETVEFDPSFCSYPSLIHVSGSVYAISYVNTGDDGTVKTIAIETLAPGGVSQLTFMGIG